MSVDLLATARRARFMLRDSLCGAGSLARASDFVAFANALVAKYSLAAIDANTFGLLASPVGDGECSITASAAILTSPNNPWVAGDVGKTIYVAGAGAAGGTLQTTIAAYTNAGQVSLSANASTTVASTKTSAGGLAVWGDSLTLTQTIPSYAASATSVKTYAQQDTSAGTVTATGSTTARSLADRFAEQFNVMDYGAVGDGIVDDTVAIQAAITAAQAVGQGTVRFPRKTFKTTATLTVSASDISLVGDNCLINTTFNGAMITIAGSGSGSEIYRNAIYGIRAVATAIGGGGQHGVIMNNVRDCVLEECDFKDFAGTGAKANNNCARIVIRDCKADNIGVVGFYSEGDGAGGFGGNSFIWFINNRVLNFYYGIEAKETTDVFIHDNQVMTGRVASNKYGILVTRNYSAGTEITPQRISIKNNQVRNPDYQGINVTQSVDVVISGNVVSGAGNTGIVCSGSVAVVSDNICDGCVQGFSCNYNANATGGAGGAAATYDAAYMAVQQNVAKGTVSNYSFDFNKCDKSNIANNIAAYPAYAGYAFHFADCDYSTVADNSHFGGSATYGFRYDNDNLETCIRNNRSTGASSGEESWPSDLTNAVIMSGNQAEDRLARAQTTDATQTHILTRTLATNTLEVWDIDVACKSSSGMAYYAGYKIVATVYRAAGSAAILATVTAVHTAESNAALDATVTVSGNDARLSVTGIAASNIMWNARVSITKRVI